MRIISGRTLDFFQRLPDELFNIFDLLSDSPGAKLYSAYMNYKVRLDFFNSFLSIIHYLLV